MENVSDILHWYKKNFRELPWRDTRDPYKIWLSEVILQQTQVKQGLSYYERFVHKYPSVRHLAEASEEEVLKLWQGLGYYTRARNLHKTAKLVLEQHGGTFPDTYEALSALPGIGDYTASAILSFAYGKSYPVLDGNVFRLVSRLFDLHLPINDNKHRKTFKDVLTGMIENTNPSDFNNAMMEMGAMVCKPENPACGQCPARLYCLAYKKGTVDLLPLKPRRTKPGTRYFNYLYIRDKGHFYLEKREGNDIWKNLYQLPLVESDREIDSGTLKNSLAGIVEAGEVQVTKKYALRHQLTHQTIEASFWELEVKGSPAFSRNGFKAVTLKNYTKYPVPVLIDKFLLYLSHK